MLATPSETEIFDLRTLVGDTLALVELDLQRERAEVAVVVGDNIPPISGVRVELQQVLINLISNAAQAMSASGSSKRLVTIALEAPADADHILISVRDTGTGLAPEAKEKLFKPFFTTKENGMGIGLSICRSTIEARGGTLEGSNHPDGGAIFEIKLPKETASA